jgi:hypothetical protein
MLLNYAIARVNYVNDSLRHALFSGRLLGLIHCNTPIYVCEMSGQWSCDDVE